MTAPTLADSYMWSTIRAASRVSIEGRDRTIREAHGMGFSMSDIAIAARLSRSRVRQIIERGDPVYS